MPAPHLLGLCRELLVLLDGSGDLQQSLIILNKDLSEFSVSEDDDPEIAQIQNALELLRGELTNVSNKKDDPVFRRICRDTLEAAHIFLNVLKRESNPQILEIERRLFAKSFSPGNDPKQLICPLYVYLMHDFFLTSNDPVYCLSTAAMTGKTLCAPILLLIRAMKEGLEKPFVVVRNPYAGLDNAVCVYQSVLQDTVHIVKDLTKAEELIQQKPDKPVLWLPTDLDLVESLSPRKESLHVFEKCRFVIDQFHTRHEFISEACALIIGQKARKSNCPMHVLLMSLSPVDAFLNDFGNDVPVSGDQGRQSIWPIEDRTVHAGDNLDESVLNTTLDVIKEMAEGRRALGHILVFFKWHPLLRELELHITDHCSCDGKRVKVLPSLVDFQGSQDGVLKRLDQMAGDSLDDTIYVLLICASTTVRPGQVAIARNPIPDHQNVIKVIIAMSYFQDEVVDGLSVVIDPGIQTRYDTSNDDGVKRRIEFCVAKQTRIQRRGRLGTTCGGLYIGFDTGTPDADEVSRQYYQSENLSGLMFYLEYVGVDLGDLDVLQPYKSREMRKRVKSAVTVESHKEVLAKLGAFLPLYQALPVLCVAMCDEGNFASACLMGALVLFVVRYVWVVRDALRYVPCLAECFCESSDVITLLSVFLDIKQKETDGNELFESSGVMPMAVRSVVLSLERLAHVLDVVGDKRAIWQNLNSFYTSTNMTAFLGDLFSYIGETNPKWLECRRCVFDKIYSGSKPKMCFTSGTGRQITVFGRPGAKGFATPAECLVLSLTESAEGEYTGGLIHEWRSEGEGKYKPHPRVIEVPEEMSGVFAQALLHACLMRVRLVPFRTDTPPSPLFYIHKWNNKFVLSFIPQSPSGSFVENTVSNVQKLMPFVPRCILAGHRETRTVVAVTGVASHRYVTNVFLLEKLSKLYHLYAIEVLSIHYLFDHLDDLARDDNSLLIALWTNSLFDCQRELYDSRAALSVSCDPRSANRLVIMSKKKIPQLQSQKLEWSDLVSEDRSVLREPNRIYPKIIRFKHNSNTLFATTNGQVVIDGEADGFDDITSVNRFLERCAELYIRNNSLVRNFEFSGFKIQSDVTRTPKPKTRKISRDSSCELASSKTYLQLNVKGSKVPGRVKRYVTSCKEVDEVMITTVEIAYWSACRLPKEEFQDIVYSISDRYSPIIYRRGYRRVGKSHLSGIFWIELYGWQFATPLGIELKNGLASVEYMLEIPPWILPSFSIFQREYGQACSECIDKWISTNGLNLRRENGNYYGTLEETNKALRLLSRESTRPQFPFVCHAIKSGIDFGDVVKLVRKTFNAKWVFDASQRLLITPVDECEEDVKQFLDELERVCLRPRTGPSAIFADFAVCETEELSTSTISVYHADGSVTRHQFCRGCAWWYLADQILNKFFDPQQGEPDWDQLDALCVPPAFIGEYLKDLDAVPEDSGKEMWPSVPLGQFLWSLLLENEKLRGAVRTWVMGVIQSAIHSSEDFTYCPVHPEIVMKKPHIESDFQCSVIGCEFRLCSKCGQWHRGATCPKECHPGCRCCPKCGNSYWKQDGDCVVMQCSVCSCWFCYYCGEEAAESRLVSRHARQAHGSVMTAPPDYRKFVLHEDVSDHELQEFYFNYPHLKPRAGP